MTTSEAPGLLLALVDVPPEIEPEFNRWYDTEHIPERLAVPGFRGARRYRSVEPGGPYPSYFEGTPRYQALYELDSPAILDSPGYKRLGETLSEDSRRIVPRLQNVYRGVFTEILPDPQGRGDPAEVGGLLLVGLTVAAAHDEEFNAWYDTEHIPFLGAVSGVLRARRFAPIDGSKRYLAVYEFADLGVIQTEEWNQVAYTPWTRRLVAFSQFWLHTHSRPLVPATT